MKTLTLILSLLITAGFSQSITVNHNPNGVAPVTKTVTYNVVTLDRVPNLLFLDRNLGATNQATSLKDNSEAAAGWFWQFNKKQGYKHDGTRTPNTTWIRSSVEYSEWLPVNDPCALEIGNGWRIPTGSEWDYIEKQDNWGWGAKAFNSKLKLHFAGSLDYFYGQIEDRGKNGFYWSSSQSMGVLSWASALFMSTSQVKVKSYYDKAFAYPLRCVKTK